MIRLEFERTIDRSIDEVFARLADIDSYEDWLPHSLIFRGGRLVESDQEVTTGTRFVDETPLGQFFGEVTEFEPPTHIAFEQNLGRNDELVFSSRPAYVLESTEHGTKVSHYAEGELFGPMRLAEPIVWMLARNERKRTLETLKRSLEDR